jgi:predicted RNase H-like HicB family nuclease
MDRYSILFEEICEPGFPAGWYYAIVPTLNLTTHGEGLEGARKAVTELLQGWLAEKRANGEDVPREPPVFFTRIEIPDGVEG